MLLIFDSVPKLRCIDGGVIKFRIRDLNMSLV